MTAQAATEGRRASLKDHAGTVGAVMTAAGAVWFVFVSLLSAWVYEPLGVSPRDLGLSSSTVLVQATLGLVAAVSVGVAIGILAGGVFGGWSMSRSPEMRQLEEMPLPFVSDDPESNAAAAAHLRARLPELSQDEAEQSVRAAHDTTTKDETAKLRASMPADVSDELLAEITRAMNRDLPREQLRFHAIRAGVVGGAYVAAVLTALGCVLAVWEVASNSRDALRAGQAPGFVFGLPAPWSGTIARVHLVGETPAADALPRCALFLGQHDGTVFLREGAGPTLRVPASMVRLNLDDASRCP